LQTAIVKNFKNFLVKFVDPKLICLKTTLNHSLLQH
jgi:hypothetical protein